MDRKPTTLLDACRGTVPASWSFRAVRCKTLLVWRVRILGVSLRVRVLRFLASHSYASGPEPVDLFTEPEQDARTTPAEAATTASEPSAPSATVSHFDTNPRPARIPAAPSGAGFSARRRDRPTSRPQRTLRTNKSAELETSS